MNRFMRCKAIKISCINDLEDKINIFLEEKENEEELISIEDTARIPYINDEQIKKFCVLLFYRTNKKPKSINELYEKANNNLKEMDQSRIQSINKNN